ncbi:TetR/AcrR family transcriptional regulator [Bacillus massiliglaciei]|uniref:TetR/AcrR family transcriptional regulator n=1 Tax=Bacillus massiliglaciei TaxID=1816693 RepID=UPI000B2523FE|nr:TetR/AcrR family transcriptional regulator [Bacillus massiliglaciei]
MTKQDHIYEAAMQLFAERGYDGTTVPMIADRAKVGAGTIYRYFQNKESLLNELFKRCVLQFSEAIKSDFPYHSSIHQQFTHIFHRLFEFARQHGTAFVFINSHYDGYYLDDASNQTFHEFLAFIIQVIDEGKQNGVIRPLPAKALIAIVYKPTEMLVKLMEAGELSYSEELLEKLRESFWDAIRKI